MQKEYSFTSTDELTPENSFAFSPKPKHNSKPVRAAVAGLFSLPGDFASILGLASTGIATLFNDKSFSENLQKSTLDRLGTAWVEGTHNILGANQRHEQDSTEKFAAFLPNLLNWSKAFGSGVRAVGMAGAKKAFKQSLKEQLAKASTATARKNVLLRNAKSAPLLGEAKKAAYKHYNKAQDRLGWVLPGIQVTPSKQLKQYYKGTGLTKEQITRAVRNKRFKEIKDQVGLALAVEEGQNYFGDQVGIFGDYRDKTMQNPMDFAVERAQNDSILSNITPAVVTLGGAFLTYKGLRKLTQKNLKNVISDNIEATAKTFDNRRFMSNADPNLNKNVTANLVDKTNIWDDPAFSHLASPETEAIMRQDVPSVVQTAYNTGDFGYDIAPVTAPRQHVIELRSLADTQPELSKKLHELLQLDNNIQQYYLDAIDHSADSKLFDIDVLKQKHRLLYKELQENPATRKILKDISDIDKARLQIDVISGAITRKRAQELLQNRNVEGFFSYIPRKAVTEKDMGDKITDTFAGYNRENPAVMDRYHQREGFRIRTDLADRLEFFETNVKTSLYDAKINTIKSQVIPDMLQNQLKEQDRILKKSSEYLTELKNAELAKKIKQDGINSIRIKYIGRKNDFISKNGVTGVNEPSRNAFSILNKPVDSTAPKYIRESSVAGLPTDTTDFLRKIDNAKSKNSLVSYKDTDGYEYFFEVSPLIHKALDLSPEMSGFLGKYATQAKNIMQSVTTGPYNPVFAATTAVYSYTESLTALPVLMKQLSLGDFKAFRDSFDLIKANIKAFKEHYTMLKTQDIVDTWHAEFVRVNGDLKASPILKEYSEAQIQEMTHKLNNCLLSDLGRAGATTTRLPSTTSYKAYELKPDMTYTTKFMNLVHQKFGAVRGTKAIKTVGFIQEALKSAGNTGLFLHLAGKKGFTNSKQYQQLTNTITKFITDSSRSGNYEHVFGELVGSIAKYVPFGRVFVSSLAAKGNASGAIKGAKFLRTATAQIKKSDTKVIDVLTQLSLGAEQLKSNRYLQGLIVTAGMPAIIGYLWNHSTDSKRNNYYSLSAYDRAGKFILTDFFGEGRHLTIPMEQEVGAVTKVVETMLDSLLHGSSMQDADPNFKQSTILMQALARSLNVEDLIYPELLLNAYGYQTNFGVGGSSAISPLAPNQKNLDGSETALQNGVFSQEARAMINTIFGALGTATAHGIEQANIGIRDVGLAQGTKDFLNTMLQRNAKSIPLLPMSNKLTYKASNDTQQANKLKQNTIEKLRKIRNYNQNIGSFGRRSGNKLQNHAEIKPIPGSLSFAQQVAEYAVPEYNQKIAPIFDKISSTYKQIAAYNATGRDRTGRIVDAGDRFEYQQRKNRETQELHKKAYQAFKMLEFDLTNKFGRDISLLDLDNLKGE